MTRSNLEIAYLLSRRVAGSIELSFNHSDKEIVGDSGANDIRRIGLSITSETEEKSLRHVPAITVTPLAFESLGVRSMCTLVKTKDVTVLLDAGVALGPRFKLMPHPLEYRARDEARKRIEEAAVDAKVVTISHYHNDHHTPNFTDPVWLGSSPDSLERIYKGKIVLAKEPRQKINTESFQFGRTQVRFPQPVPHGEVDSGLGWVLPCIVERSKEKLVFAPDVQGPVVAETLTLLLAEEPDILIIGGPPTYLQGFKVGDEFLQTALRNLQRLAESIETVVIDHHLLRDAGWYDFLAPVRKAAEEAGNRILTAAELLKIKPNVLECQRQQLYEKEKPTAEFTNWTTLSEEKQSVTPPPLDSA